MVRAGNVLSSGIWANQNLPYVVTGDITVRYSTYNSATAVLTIEPGVEVRFAPGTGINIGYNNSSQKYYGALDARGTESAPIVFTSNAAAPAPGDWKGIYFQTCTNDNLTVLEHCIIEYGGHTRNADLYLSDAKPAIRYSTIRNSSDTGVYVNGTGSNGAIVTCNNLKDNLYGVYTAGSARPEISGNNFLRNHLYGIYNQGGAELNAGNNWWGDAGGPGFNGDDVFGQVNFTPWLVSESDCIDRPPTNSPPFEPKQPGPAAGAVRVMVTVEGQPVAVSLSWIGGDPNPWDAVAYDVYFGTSPENLSEIADGIQSASFHKSDLAEGSTYYWQVVTRDDAGEETAGPVWSFTTMGSPPDLVVSRIDWNPADGLEAGQEITFSATVENTGSGPVVDDFSVQFKIGSLAVGSQPVSAVIPAGGLVRVSQTWTARAGNYSIEAIADGLAAVQESVEENNTLSVDLPEIIDPTPPMLTGTQPPPGACLNQLDRIEFTLFDEFGTVDDAPVLASVILSNGSGQPVAVAVSEDNDHFTVNAGNAAA